MTDHRGSAFERALPTALRQSREGATMIKWKPDFTNDVLKKRNDRHMCYEANNAKRQGFRDNI